MKLEATFDELRPGDVLLEADGCVVRQTGVHVVERAAEGRDRLELVRPRLVSTECNLYRGFAERYLVERYLVERAPAGTTKADPADEAVLKRLTQRGPQIRSLAERNGWPEPVPPGRREHGERPEVGDVVLVDSSGLWRPAVVTKVGRLNLKVVYVTESAIKAQSWRGFLAVLSCKRKIADVYVVTGEEWAQRAIRGVDH